MDWSFFAFNTARNMGSLKIGNFTVTFWQLCEIVTVDLKKKPKTPTTENPKLFIV